jgi:microcystin-dependent protein
MKRLGLFCLFLALFLFLGTFVEGQPNQRATNEATEKYGYYYKGKLISLTPSKTLVAISEKGAAFRAFTRDAGFIRDPLSERKPLKEHGLGLYKLPALKGKAEKQIDLQAQIKKFFQESEEEIQPVFEQGQALLIPGDEIIVGFNSTVNLDQAKTFIEPHMKKLGIVEVRDHRENAFILKISKPSNGRVYEVCRSLSPLEGVHFAEPNHIVIFLHESRPPFQEGDDIFKKILAPGKNLKTGSSDPVIPSPLHQEHSSVSWEVLIDEGFEGASLPAGWSAGTGQVAGTTATEAYWSVTDYRSRSGTRSLYATGGGSAGVPPPGNYPNDCNSKLKTPMLNLAAYEEVYVEFWYYAIFGSGLDLGAVVARGSTQETTCILDFLLAALSDDPTTANGWRRALLRVPPKSRIDGITLEFIFISGSSVTGEGLYIDQVRIVATREVDTDPIGNDTYGARHYEMKNAGQIAGLGNDDNDMHVPEAWDLVSVSRDIVVAVIDAGVDLKHPDLNLVTGYEPDGSVGGGPRDPHGTAVAGNVGAMRNNSRGVMGTAPGVKIMPVFVGWSFAEVADAIDVAVAKGAHILSNSWGWASAPSQAVEDAIIDALNSGRVVLFAAGNGPDRPPYNYNVYFPARLTGSTDVICVGASSPTDEHKSVSSSDGSSLWGSSYVGDGPDVVAPSPWSYTTDIQGNEGYNPDTWFLQGSLIDPSDPRSEDYTPTFGGTSSATPKVAGIVALMLSAKSDLTPREVKIILRAAADDIDAPGFDDKTGAGRVNAYKAVKAAFDWRRQRDIPPGTIVAFAGTANAVPDGWFLCDGRAVPRFQYQSLFFAIGTAHGQGDGSTTFNLPDYRGYFLRGADLGAGNDPDSAYRTSLGPVPSSDVGSVQGDATRIPSNFQVEQGGAHTHLYTYTKNHHHTGRRVDSFDNGGDGLYEQDVTGETSGVVVHSHRVTGGDKETRPKNKNVNWIIKY